VILVYLKMVTKWESLTLRVAKCFSLVTSATVVLVLNKENVCLTTHGVVLNLRVEVSINILINSTRSKRLLP
jgi:hypothetical protein